MFYWVRDSRFAGDSEGGGVDRWILWASCAPVPHTEATKQACVLLIIRICQGIRVTDLWEDSRQEVQLDL